jgi:hypothetical protein
LELTELCPIYRPTKAEHPQGWGILVGGTGLEPATSSL